MGKCVRIRFRVNRVLFPKSILLKRDPFGAKRLVYLIKYWNWLSQRLAKIVFKAEEPDQKLP